MTKMAFLCLSVDILFAGMIDGFRSGDPKPKGTSCWWSTLLAVLDDQSPKHPYLADWKSLDLQRLDSSHSSYVILIFNVSLLIDVWMYEWIYGICWPMSTLLTSHLLIPHSMAIKNLPPSLRASTIGNLYFGQLPPIPEPLVSYLVYCTIHLLIGSYIHYSMHGTIAEIPHRTFLQHVSIANYPHARIISLSPAFPSQLILEWALFSGTPAIFIPGWVPCRMRDFFVLSMQPSVICNAWQYAENHK